MFDGEIIFHFQKTVLLQVKGLIQIIVTFRTEKISLHVSLPSTKHPFEGYWHTVHQQSLCSNTLKRNKLKVCGFLKESKLAYFTNSKGSSQALALVHDFWKKYYLRQYEVHVCSPWLCMHVPKTLCKQGMQKKNCLPQFPIFLAHKNRLHLYLQFFVDINTYKDIGHLLLIH